MRIHPWSLLVPVLAIVIILTIIMMQPITKTQAQKNAFLTLLEQQTDFSLQVQAATQNRDGIHYEGGSPDALAWGPKLYSVTPEGTVWIDDTPAQRKILVNTEGEIIDAQPYTTQNTPRETYAQDQQLTEDLLRVKEKMSKNEFYKGYTVSEGETFYWGTSPEGFQYWQTTETRQDDNGVLRVRAFLHAVSSSGRRIATAEIPVSSEYTTVFHDGIYVDAAHNRGYYLTTHPAHILIQSVDWKLTK